MKTQEQQKSELCDKFFISISTGLINDNNFVDFMVECTLEYEKITQQKPLSQNPYCDEVFDGRLMTIINKYWSVDRKNQLSEMPNISFFRPIKGFGKKMEEQYIEVMSTYKMFNKI